MRIIITILITCLLFSISGFTETKKIDENNGNDWREWNLVMKTMYVSGFLAGTSYIYDKSEYISYTNNRFDFKKASDMYWSLVESLLEEKEKVPKKIYTKEEVRQILEFESKRNNVEINNFAILKISVSQIRDGLNLLYDDFKNRQILLVDAIYVVKKQINGSSNEEVEAVLQWLRSPDKKSKKGLPEFIEKDGTKKPVIFP